MIVFKRVTQDGDEIEIGVPLTNISEVSPHKEVKDRVWVKYWNGSEIRSMVVIGTVEEIAVDVRRARHGGTIL